MKRVLIVWCELGGESTFILRENVDEEEHMFLLGCHNRYINSVDVDEKEQEELNDHFFTADGKEKFQAYKEIPSGHFDAVVLTGIVL